MLYGRGRNRSSLTSSYGGDGINTFLTITQPEPLIFNVASLLACPLNGALIRSDC